MSFCPMANTAASSSRSATASDANPNSSGLPNLVDDGHFIPAWILTAQHPNGGIYALQAVPMSSMMPPPPPSCNFHGALVPVTYNIPSRNSTDSAENSGDSVGGDQRREEVQQGRRGDIHRQRLLRLLTGFQIGLLLGLKVSVILFLLHRSGSKDRLRIMMCLNIANLVYLYRVGAFDPLVKWLSETARRIMLPAQPTVPAAEDQQNSIPEDGNMAVRGQNFHWQGIIKEVQMIVVGFFASLFPGFRFPDHV